MEIENSIIYKEKERYNNQNKEFGTPYLIIKHSVH
jgi:hypothetical protein